jgi:hypothetical protein
MSRLYRIAASSLRAKLFAVGALLLIATAAVLTIRRAVRYSPRDGISASRDRRPPPENRSLARTA